MRKISYIKSGPAEGSVFVGVISDDLKEKFYISRTEYARCGAPERGDEIDEDMYLRMARYNEYYKAKKKALSLLAYGDNNEKNLIRKLRVAGFAPDLAKMVTEEMVSLGYIREDDQLRRLITAEANGKLQGPNKIFQKLVAKGYSTTDVRSMMEILVDEGEINFKNSAMLLIEKKLPKGATSDEKKTLLYKNGYKL